MGSAGKRLRLRTARTAVCNGLTNFARPRNVTFQATVRVRNESETGFKRLEEDPKTRRKKCNRPSKEEEEDQPKEGKTGISAHRGRIWIVCENRLLSASLLERKWEVSEQKKSCFRESKHATAFSTDPSQLWPARLSRLLCLKLLSSAGRPKSTPADAMI